MTEVPLATNKKKQAFMNKHIFFSIKNKINQKKNTYGKKGLRHYTIPAMERAAMFLYWGPNQPKFAT